jgi:hypothetical protein
VTWPVSCLVSSLLVSVNIVSCVGCLGVSDVSGVGVCDGTIDNRQ